MFNFWLWWVVVGYMWHLSRCSERGYFSLQCMDFSNLLIGSWILNHWTRSPSSAVFLSSPHPPSTWHCQTFENLYQLLSVKLYCLSVFTSEILHFSYLLWFFSLCELPVYSVSVQFSHSVMFDSLQPHGPQHARLPCPSPTPGACSNSCLLSQWCHPTISSSVIPFSSLLQSFPASESFPLSQFFESGGQNIGVSASASVLPMNFQDWFPLGWTSCISLQSKGLSRVFSNTTVQNNSLVLSFLFGSTLTSIHGYWKSHSFN